MARRPIRRPIEDGYFTIPDEPSEAPRLLGSRCPACGEHFFPRRVVCARCLAEGCVDVLLGPRGHIYTWTYVHVPLFAKLAFDKMTFGQADVDLALCHDAFANEELEYYELLGFCPEGGGERLVDEGATALGGSIPFNTDGGLIARGHPGGPTGLAMVHEIVRQLRGEAGERQVAGARTALAHLVGGGSVCTVSLFQSD